MIPVRLGWLRLLGRALASWAMAAGTAGAAASPVTIELLAEARAAAADVRLRDVARIHAASPQAALLWEAVVLGPAPAVGLPVSLPRERLAAHLERHARRTGQALPRWSGAETVVLTREQQSIPGTALRSEAVRAVGAWLKQQPVSRFELESGSPLADVDVPAGTWTLAARPLAAAQPPVGRITVWVEVSVDQRIERRVPVAIKVRAFGPRWQARTDLSARTPVGLESFELTESELTVPYLPAVRKLPAGMRLARALAAGQPLLAAHIEQATEVTRGDIVAAHLRRGLVSVHTRGEALQDGRNGQQVRVRIAGSTGPVRALVTGPGTVQVSE